MRSHKDNIVLYFSAVILLLLAAVARADEPVKTFTTQGFVDPALPPAPADQIQNAAAASGGAQTPVATPPAQAPASEVKKANVNIYGYVEGGYLYDFTSRDSGTGPTFILYNTRKNEVILDKVSLNVERTVDPTKKRFDMGFHVEGIYGEDAALIHSNGLGDTQTGRNQWDLLQAYADVTLPDMPLRLRVGKWIELAGFEQFSANIYGAFGDPARALYSYSYQFSYAEPGTQTGALATYVLNPRWSFDAGLTRGWNQSLRDANNAPDFLGRVTFTPSDKTSAIFVMTEGPEFPAGIGKNQPQGDNSDWWTALDLVITHKVSDKLSLGLGFDDVETPHISGLAGGARQWGGAAGYVSYAFDPRLTLNTRLEWYKDAADGFSTGAPVSADYYETTVGVAIRPFPKNKSLSHLLVRPELRYDHSNRPVFGDGNQNESTVSVGALYTF
jgi:hypothetical protein